MKSLLSIAKDCKGSVKKSTSRIQDNFHLQKRIQECPSQDMIPDNICTVFEVQSFFHF